MPIIAIRVLIINQRIDFAVSLKQALEDTGLFEVYPFTGVDTALDYLRQHPQNVALIDFNMLGASAESVVGQLRALQPEIAIIASPRSIETAVVRKLDLQATIDIPFTARDLIPLIQAAVREKLDALPDTSEVRLPTEEESDTLKIARRPPDVPEFSSLDSIVLKMGGFSTGDTEIETSGLDPDQLLKTEVDHQESRRTFERLAAEEPPMPSLEESGTLADLRLGVTDTHFAEVMAILRREQGAAKPLSPLSDESISHETPPVTAPEFTSAEVGGQTTAQLILRATEETPTNDTGALDEMLRNIAAQLPPNTRAVQPLPSWIERERALNEPDFLGDLLPPEVAPSGQTTRPSSSQEKLIEKPGDLETDRLTPHKRSVAPPPHLPEQKRLTEQEKTPPVRAAKPPAPPEVPEDESSDTGLLNCTEVIELQTDFYRLAAFELPPDVIKAREVTTQTPILPQPPITAKPETAPITAEPPAAPSSVTPPPPAEEAVDGADQLIAQLAVSLTQASLELTAEATVLARGGEIVAYAGNLPQADLDEMRAALNGDWEASNQEGTRIRFVTLASNGKDYMLYSRRTIEGYTLTMVFAGDTPIADIRQQGNALAEALVSPPPPPVSVPEMPTPPAITPPVEAEGEEAAALVAIDAGPLLPYAYLWLLRDPKGSLSEESRTTITRGLRRQLEALGWQIVELQVDEDYVYLLANVPGLTPANEIVRDLKRRAAELVNSDDPENLWSDSYLVVTPGRPLDFDEIQQFISFDRM